MKNATTLMYIVNAILYLITDDTTFGVWAVIFMVMYFGYTICDKLDALAKSK